MPHHLSPLGNSSQASSPSPSQSNNHCSSHWQSENDLQPSISGYPPNSQPTSHHPVGTNPPGQSSQNPATPMTMSYVYQQPPLPPPPTSQYHHPQSNTSAAPWTPAPTTSDVHNRNSRSNSVSSSASSESVVQSQPSFMNSEMLSRYLTIDPIDSPVVHETRRAIQEGRVQEGENMLTRRCEEQGWRILSPNDEYDEQHGQDGSDGSGGSRTLGRSRDGRVE